MFRPVAIGCLAYFAVMAVLVLCDGPQDAETTREMTETELVVMHMLLLAPIWFIASIVVALLNLEWVLERRLSWPERRPYAVNVLLVLPGMIGALYGIIANIS